MVNVGIKGRGEGQFGEQCKPPAPFAGHSQKHPRPLILTWPSHSVRPLALQFFSALFERVLLNPPPECPRPRSRCGVGRGVLSRHVIRQITSQLGWNTRCVVCLRLCSTRRRLGPRLGGAPCYLANRAEIHSTV